MAVAKRRPDTPIAPTTKSEKSAYQKNLEKVTAEHKGKYRTVQGGGANKNETKTIPEVNKKGAERLARNATIKQNAPHVKTPHRTQDYLADKGHNVPNDKTLDPLYEKYGERDMIPVTYKGKVAKPNYKGETPVVGKSGHAKQKTETKSVTTYVSDIVPSAKKTADLNTQAIEKQAPRVGHIHEVSNEQKKAIAKTVKANQNLTRRESPTVEKTDKGEKITLGNVRGEGKPTVKQTNEGIYINKRGAMYHQALKEADIKSPEEERNQSIYSNRGATSKIIKNSGGWYEGDTTNEKIVKETLNTIHGKEITAGQILHNKQMKKAQANKNKKELDYMKKAGASNIRMNEYNNAFNKKEAIKAKEEGRKPKFKPIEPGGKADQAHKNWSKFVSANHDDPQVRRKNVANLYSRALEKKTKNPSAGTRNKEYQSIGNIERGIKKEAGNPRELQKNRLTDSYNWSFASPKMETTMREIFGKDELYFKSRATHYKNVMGIDENGNYKTPTQPKPRNWDDAKSNGPKNYFERHNVYVDANGEHKKNETERKLHLARTERKPRSGAEALMKSVSDSDILSMFGDKNNGKK